MTRLKLLLAPAACVLAGMGFSYIMRKSVRSFY